MFRFNKAIMTKTTARIVSDISRLIKHHKLTPTLKINAEQFGIISTRTGDLDNLGRSMIRNAFKSFVFNTSRYSAEACANYFIFKDESGMYLFFHPTLADLDPTMVELRATLVACCPAAHYDELLEEANVCDIDVLMADNSYPFNTLVNDMKAVHSRLIKAAASHEMLMAQLDALTDASKPTENPLLADISISTPEPVGWLGNSLSRLLSNMSSFGTNPLSPGELYHKYAGTVDVVDGGKYWPQYPLVDADEYVWDRPLPAVIANRAVFMHSIRFQPGKHPHNERVHVIIKATHMTEEESQLFFPINVSEEAASAPEPAVVKGALTAGQIFSMLDVSIIDHEDSKRVFDIEVDDDTGVGVDTAASVIRKIVQHSFAGWSNDQSKVCEATFAFTRDADDCNVLKSLAGETYPCSVKFKLVSHCVELCSASAEITSIALSVSGDRLTVSCFGKKEFIKEEIVDYQQLAAKQLEELSRAFCTNSLRHAIFKVTPSQQLFTTSPNNKVVADFFNLASFDASGARTIAAWLGMPRADEPRTLTLRAPKPLFVTVESFEVDFQACIEFSNTVFPGSTDAVKISKVKFGTDNGYAWVTFTYVWMPKQETSANKLSDTFNKEEEMQPNFAIFHALVNVNSWLANTYLPETPGTAPYRSIARPTDPSDNPSLYMATFINLATRDTHNSQSLYSTLTWAAGQSKEMVFRISNWPSNVTNSAAGALRGDLSVDIPGIQQKKIRIHTVTLAPMGDELFVTFGFDFEVGSEPALGSIAPNVRQFRSMYDAPYSFGNPGNFSNPDMGLPAMPKNFETTKPIQPSMDRIRASKLYWDMLEEMFENEKVNDSSAKLANTAKKLDAFVLEILSLA